MEIIKLTDERTGSTAEILPGFGFNCFRFVAMAEGQPVDVLWSAPNFAAGSERPSGSGIPLLFPFPGRIRQGKFTWQGRRYEIPPGDPLGNAIHGFVLNRPWQVVEQTPCRAVGMFHASAVDAALADSWPTDFRLTVSYEVDGTALRSEIRVENPDERPLPCGFGTHPYFRVPLGAGGSAAQCRVTVPAASYWKLDGMLPTGDKLPVDAPRDLRQGKPFDETMLDDVLSDLQCADRRCAARIEDESVGRRLTLSFDDSFQHAVVYNPPHREAICIEPYTCVPDPFWLEEQGVASGLRVLGPGESFTGRIDITVE